MNTSKILTLTALRKTYGGLVAVDGVSFDVDCGQIVGLLGPNGAGKTTTINMILGVVEPDGGTICVGEFDLMHQRSRALERTNFAAAYAPLPGNLTVFENLNIFGRLYGVKNLSERIDESLTEFNLRSFRDKRCGALSSGEQTRVSLAKAMLNRPRLLLLDEPTASLDPAVAREIRVLIREFVSRTSAGVLWTSHNMTEVRENCDRVLFLSHGKLLLQGNPKTLPAEHGKADLEELFITVAREPLTLEIG